MNSRSKGKVGEREFAARLRAEGFAARRGQQFAGGGESPDVVSPALPWLHIEVKRVQHLNLTDACAQAEGDCGGKPWIVAHRRNHAPWLITMRSETFFALVREFEPPRDTKGREGTTSPQALTPSPSPIGWARVAQGSPQCGEGDGAHGVTRPTREGFGGGCVPAAGHEQPRG